MKLSVSSRDKKPSIARRPFQRSALAVNGPKLRASVDSPFSMGTTDAPLIFSATAAHTIPSIACCSIHPNRPLMVSGAAPSNAKMLPMLLSPKEPDVGLAPNTDCFSDSFTSWFCRTSSLVISFFVALSTASLTPSHLMDQKKQANLV
ncbi:hypothetical protein MARPO_0041s0140 [Marchantia polymorpha]|uniref:Uncharacterized protein n=1 Tax=Marchantia polymorpha TaxID=3197 RepID=A0A2R6X2E5_MARPO|nr:hypothetical protein MARPO_0041s0140 [Marchantia polymorpha]|eukprot:PTQ40284.1 hypothetical protein MARPO_0041s0140 [Marchantia polymorpha]